MNKVFESIKRGLGEAIEFASAGQERRIAGNDLVSQRKWPTKVILMCSQMLVKCGGNIHHRIDGNEGFSKFSRQARYQKTAHGSANQ